MDGATSPYYMSRRRCATSRSTAAASVLAGVVLYELLTDARPFHGESMKTIPDAVSTPSRPVAGKSTRGAEGPGRNHRAAIEKNPKPLPVGPCIHPRPAPVARCAIRAPEGEAMARRCPAPPSRRRVAARPGSPPRRWRRGGRRHAPSGGRTARRPVTTAATATASTSKPTAEVRPPAPTVAATPSRRCGAADPGGDPADHRGPAHRDPGASAPADRDPDRPNNAAAQERCCSRASCRCRRSPAPPADRPRPPRSRRRPRPRPRASRHRPAPRRRPAPRQRPPPRRQESAKERRAREAKERESRSRSRLAAAAPVIVATGTVRLAISPWGNVEVDGTASGTAPPLTS